LNTSDGNTALFANVLCNIAHTLNQHLWMKA